MADSILTYLLALENYGKYANEEKAAELIERYWFQIEPQIDYYLQKFDEDSKIGKLIRDIDSTK